VGGSYNGRVASVLVCRRAGSSMEVVWWWATGHLCAVPAVHYSGCAAKV
jgi:hypothetical protein